MINSTGLFVVSNFTKPSFSILNIDGQMVVTSNLHSGWIFSPTITAIGIILIGLISWNIWITYKLHKKQSEETK